MRSRKAMPAWATWLTVAAAALLWTHGVMLILQWMEMI